MSTMIWVGVIASTIAICSASFALIAMGIDIIKNFKIALTDEQNIMSKTPSDYRLVRLAKFDEKTGLFEEAKENIYDGISLSE